ncbi:hypothetical protein CR513_03114, partial [Mucuna pruriens]
MRERFVSSFYTRDLYIKLQRLYQEFRSVEEYFKEIENLKEPLWLDFCMALIEKFKMLNCIIIPLCLHWFTKP